jgi:hypothetical protein
MERGLVGDGAVTTSRYEEKIDRIRAGQYRAGDFILADAKDADLSGGIPATGQRRGGNGVRAGSRSRREFLAEMRALIDQDVVDIMLASTSNIEVLHEDGAFNGSRVLPAFRGNDATDMWVAIRGGTYRETPSLPFSSTDLALAKADLCLYSVTFNRDAERDVATLEAYAGFRQRALQAGKAHFLEVFNPNVLTGFTPVETGQYVNDCIARTLAGLTRAERPQFLKVAYNGPAALEELASHDSSVVVGVLGGGSGTHRDTFELVRQSEKYGARIALFGRKINMAESQTTFMRWLRAVADLAVTPVEAVKGYHADLAEMGLTPDRSIDDDLRITEEVLTQAA